MLDWWYALTPLHQVLYTVALPATLLLLIQTVLMLFGLGDHGADGADGADMDAGGIDTDGDGGADVFDHSGDSDIAAHGGGLRVFTLRGLVAFFCVGSWAGIAALDLGVAPPLSALLAVAVGAVALLLVALLLRWFTGLSQSGNVELRNAVGQEGEVYLAVPADGRGKVTVLVQERLSECEAVSADHTPLPTGARVRVVSVTEDQLLVVAKI